MPESEIIAEIHRTRADIARECDYDVGKLFLVPKLNLGTHLSAQLHCPNYRHGSQRSKGVVLPHHSWAEE